MQPIVGQLDEDEEDGDGGAVDAQSHGGRGQGLWRGEAERHSVFIFHQSLIQCIKEAPAILYNLIAFRLNSAKFKSYFGHTAGTVPRVNYRLIEP